MKRRCAVSAHTRALLLGMLTLVVSVLCIAGCKHPTTDTKPEDLSVTVTVKGDRHITVHEPQRFTVPTGTAWRTVQEKIHIAVESGYEHTGWKLESIIGMDLTDDYVFNESKTVFAVSKRIGSVSPEKITVTLAADAGYTVNDVHTYEVPLGTTWNDIKETAQKAVTLKAGYDALGWKLENAGGADITDSTVFIKNGTVIAVSKLHGASAPEKITITVQGDSNLSVSSDNTFTVDKQPLWQNIRAAAESKITAHAGYELAEWRLNTETGSVLTGEYGFTGDTVVFAVSRQEEDEPSGPIDPAIFKTDGHGTIIGYTCAKEALPKILVIPDKIGDELITKIGEKAFCETDIKKLDMSQMSSLKTIENLAFCCCHNLKNIKFPISLERIEDGELDTDPRLLQPYWYKDGVFSRCENITKVEFPKGSHLSYVGSAAFQDCFYGIDYYPARYPENRGLPNIDLSNCTMLIEIGNGAFSGNYLLQEIKLPPSITSLGRRVFYKCGCETDNGIAELDLSACTSLKTLHRALLDRVKIKILKLPTSIEAIEDGYWQGESLVGVFEGCRIEVIDLSACTNLTRIGKGSFWVAKIQEVKLPATIETIGSYAFAMCKNLSGTFTFPAALKTIEERAFWGCSGIASLNFSACTDLETIGQYAFQDCTGITGTVTFPAGLKTIGKYAFSSDDTRWQPGTGIQGLDFSACTQLETIDEGAFKGCSGLTSINLTGCGIKTIGKEAFFCCTGLPALGLSGCNRLETIGEAAFTGCANIAGAIVFPATLKKIAEDAFSFGFHSGEPGYAALTKITALDFSACTQLETIDEDAFKDCSGITSINFIGCGVKTIGGAAFSRCTGLPALDLSGCTRLETIGYRAFLGCVNIAGTVAFPATLKKIEWSAFSDAQGYSDSSALTKITAVDFSRSSLLEEIGSGAFACCSGITGTLTLPASLKNLAENAFGSCTGITTVHLKSGTLEPDGYKAFKDCTAFKTLIIESGDITFTSDSLVGGSSAVLETVILKEGVTSIGRKAFESCKKLRTIDMSACTRLTAIGERAFSKCAGLERLLFPASLKTLGNYAFENCTALNDLDFSACTALESTGESVFSGCTALPSVNLIPCTALKTIGDGTFISCTNMTEVKLPAGLVAIQERAFALCKKIASLDLSGCPALETIGRSAFAGCTGITGTVTFPAGLKTIGKQAFADEYGQSCTGIQGLDFSACTSLETIEEEAFVKCTGMTGTLTLPSALTVIGERAFSKTTITSLDISACSALTSIGKEAFYECSGLTGTVNFPVNLKKIERSAFYKNGKLTELDFSQCTGLKTIEENAFRVCSMLTRANLSACTDLETLEDGVFKNCEELTVLSLPAGLKSIGQEACYNCKKLANLDLSTFPSLETIGREAFAKCIQAEVAVPASIQTIGRRAFGDAIASDECRKVNVPNIDIRAKVLASGYPSHNIGFTNPVFDGTFYFIDTEKTMLLKGADTLTGNIIIPSTVKSIEEGAFYHNGNITGVDCSGCTALTAIGRNAFCGCNKINGLLDLSGCTALTTIGEEAFGYCTKAVIKLPASIQTIDRAAFESCKKVQVPNEEIKQKVTESGYPESKIGLY